jgi:cytochrome c
MAVRDFAALARALTILALVACAAGPAQAELRGHGGPVRAVAALADGRHAVSGSFDQSAIVWDLERGTALSVLRFHDGAVNAVAPLPDGGFATAGEDGRIALWRIGIAEPAATLAAHTGPIASLALSSDGRRLASASWDGTGRVSPLPDGPARILDGHAGPVNAVAFATDGRVVTGGHDLTVRFWPDGDGAPTIVTLPSPVNTLTALPDGGVAAAGGDGVLRLLATDGAVKAELDLRSGPILGLSSSPDGRRLAAAAIGGSVSIVSWPDNRVLFRLVGPGLPVWSIAYSRDGRELLTGGSDRLVRRWDATTGEHIGPVVMARPEDLLAVEGAERGAQVFKACAACHTLTPDGGNRAGPSLHGLFGRRIATLPGYNFSDALKRLDIVWTAETIGKLFEVGPARYTPGTKMPEQTVSDADRAALVAFLEKATR